MESLPMGVRVAIFGKIRQGASDKGRKQGRDESACTGNDGRRTCRAATFCNRKPVCSLRTKTATGRTSLLYPHQLSLRFEAVVRRLPSWVSIIPNRLKHVE
eukprot:326198-Prorocentrum_minimum.AAC.1